MTNHREDDYGGDFEGRTRLTRDVTAAVRDVWPDDKPVFVRISATDWLPDRDAWTVEDSVRLSDRLADIGADFIDVSGGGIHPESRPVTPVRTTNSSTPSRFERKPSRTLLSALSAASRRPNRPKPSSLRTGRHGIVGREHLRNPYFTMTAAKELDATDEIAGPAQSVAPGGSDALHLIEVEVDAVPVEHEQEGRADGTSGDERDEHVRRKTHLSCTSTTGARSAPTTSATRKASVARRLNQAPAGRRARW